MSAALQTPVRHFSANPALVFRNENLQWGSFLFSELVFWEAPRVWEPLLLFVFFLRVFKEGLFEYFYQCGEVVVCTSTVIFAMLARYINISRPNINNCFASSLVVHRWHSEWILSSCAHSSEQI